jgi:DNA-binding transcriptional LysR family regulator
VVALRLNLRQIEVFRATMLTGSISGAAKMLDVSQPAVSRLISTTEQRLGLTFFQRIKGRLYPTPEAQRLFQAVDVVYQGVERVNEVAEDLIENRMGHLRIACNPSLGQLLIPQAVKRFYERMPDVRVLVHTYLPSVLLQSVLTQQVELGVSISQDAHPNIQVKPLYENPLVVALPAGHPLAVKKTLHVKDLEAQTFVGYGADTSIGRLVRKLFMDEGILLHPKVEVQQVHVACAFVQAGIGVSIIDALAAKSPAWPGMVVRPLKPAASAPVSIIHGVFSPPSRIAQEFITILEDMYPR